MKWTIKGAGGAGDFRYPDGEYVFTLQIDYGTRCRAVSEVMQLEGGRVVRVRAGTALMSECTSMVRKHRQHGASLGLDLTVTSRKKQTAEPDEPDDERCYFPLTSVEVGECRDVLAHHPLIRTAYRIIDKESYLDWGLNSDYLGGEPGA